MSNKLTHIISFLILILAMQSCQYYNTLFPKKKDNYQNYKSIFENPDVSKDVVPAPRPKQLYELINDDSKIRIITINKITGDTIVEWVSPEVVTLGKELKVPIPIPDTTIDNTVYPGVEIVEDSVVLARHKAVIFQEPIGAFTRFFLRNDTLIIAATPNMVQKALQGMMGKTTVANIQGTILDTTKDAKLYEQNNNVPVAKNKTLKKIGNKLKDFSNKVTRKNDTLVIEPVPEMAVEQAPNKDKQLYINSDVLVGDLNFDTDPSVITILDPIAINTFLKSKLIVWESFKCKVKVKLKTMDDTKQFNATLRMMDKKTTWASVNVPIIGEVARACITPDSLQVIDKWKNKFYKHKTDALKKILQMPIEFGQLQNYIIGLPPITTIQNAIMKQSARGTAVQLNEQGIRCILTYNTKGELINMVVVGNSGGKNYSIKCSYKAYELVNDVAISTSRKIQIVDNAKQTNIDLELSGLMLNTELEFPFTIPEGYKQAYLDDSSK